MGQLCTAQNPMMVTRPAPHKAPVEGTLVRMGPFLGFHTSLRGGTLCHSHEGSKPEVVGQVQIDPRCVALNPKTNCGTERA